ncbi:hypothetical protein [Saccharothrix coeruleofusca]|uniref:Acyl-CoA dehydrogenase-like protein n=1 Tax=Saccharothrix coeruleofusca TaxID=33919 RepID=A0A918EGP9_9PSEU|nr:hypothetical protein [Saccharothrix coeruleofusca]MBP2335822.1 alkylation response protein AidB-like acyl-CoA dehydrogenase [Saccharothrix coeruleofusca]GGP74980.1 hypothetical protein GCM10010185_55590 [Saccharothrix coeruleofusca]
MFGEVLAGKRFGNARCEARAGHAQDCRTRLLRHSEGGFVLDGTKHYATGALFEVAGARACLDGVNPHRDWRNTRTHTLHDPVRWKVQHVGRYASTAPR